MQSLDEMTSCRVALFLPTLAGGGAERVALALTSALLDKGCGIDLLLVRKEGALLRLVPDQVRVLELGGGRILGSLLPLVRYLRREKPDALHAFMWPLTVVAAVARRIARVPTRLVISDHTTLSEHASGGRERQAMRLTIRRFYPWADSRVQVSRAAADDLAGFCGLERGSIEVVGNPLLVSAQVETSDEIEGWWDVPRGERILSVGSLKETKDHRALLRAFAGVPRPRARLMIVGEGPMRDELQALADRLGIGERVIWTGFQLDPWPFYASADLFVLSSRLEGQPVVLLEALASGVPIVSTDCPSGPREVLDEGLYGTLVQVEDEGGLAAAIDGALSAPSMSGALRQRARELLERGSVQRHLQLLLD